MEQNEDLIKLAAVVEDLLNDFNRLKREKSDLDLALEQKEQRIEELQATISSMKEEKSDAYQRVSGILDSIAEWEKEQQVDDKNNVSEKSNQPPSEPASQLFSME